MTKTIVILVEDDPMNRLLAIDALERAGFEVADFARAEDAASYAESMTDSIAGLLADISLPGEQDGIDLAQVFAERWPDKPIMVTSGRFGPMRPPELPRGAEYIAKPWTAKSLMVAMAERFGPTRERGL